MSRKQKQRRRHLIFVLVSFFVVGAAWRAKPNKLSQKYTPAAKLCAVPQTK